MRLIESARRLEALAPLMLSEGHTGLRECRACGAAEKSVTFMDFVHRGGCPIQSLPRIVQALEAAGRVVSIYRDLEKYEGRMDHSVAEWEALESLSEAMIDAP